MKVLLVYPKTYERRILPLGIAYIAAYLRENGHELKVYDPAPYEKIKFSDVLNEFKPGIVGFTSNTLCMPRAISMAKEVKGFNKNLPVVFGGSHPTAMPKETLELKEVDYVVLSEGEETMLDLVNTLEKNKDVSKIKGIYYKKDGKQYFTGERPFIEDLDKLPMPARDLFPMRWYTQACTSIRGCWLRVATMMSSRGCPYNCIYCSSKVIWGRRFRPRSAKNVVDEAEHLLKNYKIEAIYFLDDNFCVNKKRVFEICDEIKKRKLKFIWATSVRTELVTDEKMVKAMAEAGCIQLAFGVESGSDKVLKIMKKGNQAEDAPKAFEICKKYGIRTLTNFMLGNPGELMEDIEKSRQLAHSLNADYVDFYITTPFPGTELYDMAIKNGWIKNKNFDFNKFKIDEGESLMEINFKTEELRKIREKLKSEFVGEKIYHLLKNPRFIRDMLIINFISKPLTIPRVISKYIKTRNVEESLRVIEKAQRTRRFP